MKQIALLTPNSPLLAPERKRDSDDDYLVTLARAVCADVLVSGDSDLVDLGDPRPPARIPRGLNDLLDQIGGG